jgi:hypothetical protein
LEGDWFVVQNGDTLTDLDPMEMYDPKFQHIRWYSQNTKKEWVFAGTQLCGPDYFSLRSNHTRRNFNCDNYWIDMGTPEGLAKARKHYEKISPMPQLRNKWPKRNSR